MDAPLPRRARERDNQSNMDRGKVCMQQYSRVKPIKKVQIVYYLSRNGQLEHPHYMEVAHLANQPLRLRDVMDRLTVLRGKGMPSLYSWSCKRSYKNGYVWNDLAENDIIYPSDGAEYVLKGSELVAGCSERFQRLGGNAISNSGHLIQEPNLHEKRKQQTTRQQEETQNPKYEFQIYDQEEDMAGESQEEEYEDEEKTSYTSSTTPHSRCSRGVSTEELEEDQRPHKNPTTNVPSLSPPPTPSILNDKSKPNNSSSVAMAGNSNSTSKRFEDGDPVVANYGTAPSRNSVLLQLISCGNLSMTKAKSNVTATTTTTTLKQQEVKMNGDRVLKKGESNSLPREVLRRCAAKVAEEEMMINYMSENPRFGNLQAQEKEYFSGSIVESIREDRSVVEPTLKRSNSYNEERCAKDVMEEEAAKEEIKERAARGKCIPRKKSSSSSKQVIRK